MSFWLLLLLGLIAYALYKMHNPTNWSRVRHFDGPAMLPVVGMLHIVLRNRTIRDMYKQMQYYSTIHTSPTRAKLLHIFTVQVFRADQCEILLKSKANLTKAKPHYDYLKPWLGEGLLTSSGEKWFRQRRQLTPSFHFEILKQFMLTFNDHSREFAEYLKANTKDGPIDIRNPLTLSTLDMICETSMGKNIHALRDGVNGEYSSYIAAIKEFGNRLIWRVAKPWYRNDWFFHNIPEMGRSAKRDIDLMHTFTNKVIEEHLANYTQKSDGAATHDDGRKRRFAFLDQLIELYKAGEISREEVREQTDTFMFEGHDTTATALMWLFYCLGKYPAMQRQVQAEVDNLFESIDDDDDLSIDAISSLDYTDRFIKETQRLYPSVPIIARYLEEDVTLPNGAVLPKNISVELHIHSMHKDPAQFPEPDKFDPERFLPEEAAKRHPFAFSPFSAGPRNCIGQKFAALEIRVLCAHVLRHFNLTCNQTDDDVEPTALMVLRAEKPILVQFDARHHHK